MQPPRIEKLNSRRFRLSRQRGNPETSWAWIQNDIILGKHLTVWPGGPDLHGISGIRVEPKGLTPAIHELPTLHRTVLLRENSAFLTRILRARERGSDVCIITNGLTACGTGIGLEKARNDLEIVIRAVLCGMKAVRTSL